MKNPNTQKEYFDKLVEVLEKQFPKGEKCQCGKRLPCRSRALVLNAYANIYLKEILSQEKQKWVKETGIYSDAPFIPDEETRKLMGKEKIENCEHEFGHKVIGGFPGHEHIHPTGYQVCFNCGKTFKEILEQEKEKLMERIKLEDKFKERIKQNAYEPNWEGGYYTAMEDLETLKEEIKKELINGKPNT